MGTVHANSAADVPARLEALGLVAGLDRLAVHALVAAAVDAVIHLAETTRGVASFRASTCCRAASRGSSRPYRPWRTWRAGSCRGRVGRSWTRWIVAEHRDADDAMAPRRGGPPRWECGLSGGGAGVRPSRHAGEPTRTRARSCAGGSMAPVSRDGVRDRASRPSPRPHERTRVVQALAALAAELEAGQPPRAALRRRAASHACGRRPAAPCNWTETCPPRCSPMPAPPGPRPSRRVLAGRG